MKAELTISRVTNRDPLMSRWSLSITLADFSRILTARGGIECELEARSRGTASASDPRTEKDLEGR